MTDPLSPADMDGDPSALNWIWKGRIPCLDGLRGISIGLVTIHHQLLAWDWPGSGALGFVGVDIFFVISGFLITLLLLREARSAGKISLRGFYFRRACRILPAYIVFLLVLLALQPTGLVSLHSFEWFALLTYTVNFTSVRWEISHVWSLCVEEHFYLLWPLVMLVLGPRHAWRVAVTCILMTPLLRLAMTLFANDSVDLTKNSFSRMDTIAAGCCLAFLATNPWANCWLLPTRAQALGIGGLLTLVLLVAKASVVWLGDSLLVVYSSVNALAIAGLVWLCVVHSRSLVGRILNFGPLAGLGALSYSFYLWHKLFITPSSSMGLATHWPVNWLLAALVALASYYLIEQPMLRLKDTQSNVLR